MLLGGAVALDNNLKQSALWVEASIEFGPKYLQAVLTPMIMSSMGMVEEATATLRPGCRRVVSGGSRGWLEWLQPTWI